MRTSVDLHADRRLPKSGVAPIVGGRAGLVRHCQADFPGDIMTETTDVAAQLEQMLTGYSITQALFAAAELGIPDHIAKGTTSLDGLTEATGCNRDALFRFLRWLVARDVLDLADGVYSLKPMGELLRSDSGTVHRASARIMGMWLPAWGEILHSLKTGESGFAKAYGMDMFDYFNTNTEAGEVFDTVMVQAHGAESVAVSAAYDFLRYQCVMDVGGGNGNQMLEILRTRPDLKGIVFDRPDVAERATAAMAAAGVSDRCTAIGGNFFDAVPEGAEVILLRHVLHDWYDAEATEILANCARALPENGRILVGEAIVPEGNEPAPAKNMDLAMLVLAGGKERTEAAYRTLFAVAGLEVTRIVPTAGPTSLIEGRRRP
jgi:hypothetical protein